MPENNHKQCPVPSGILLLVGGKENKGEQNLENRESPDDFHPMDILKRFISLIEKEDPVLEIITSAGSDGSTTFDEYQKLFEGMGVKTMGHIHHNTRNEVISGENLHERIRAADAIYFTGGNQLLLASLYGGTDFLTELKLKYIYDKVVIGGTSAGAMAMSTPMIYAGNEEVQQLGGEIKITTGLEFLKDVCIDTHFVHRGRFIRLAQVIATNPSCIGLGLEEDTAVLIRNGLDAEIAGSGTVIMIEGFGITVSNMQDFTKKKPVSIRDLRVHILAGGDTFKIRRTNPPHI